jgi:16S rRNA C967 or C1407 C5-methylase (RsmB/RsmF family)
MTEEQKALLKIMAEELGGKLSYETCTTRTTEYKRIVIEYGSSQKK